MAREPMWVKCSGEAHKNPYIDHCMICMPYWEDVPVCPDCGLKLRLGKKVAVCPECRKRYNPEKRLEVPRDRVPKMQTNNLS